MLGLGTWLNLFLSWRWQRLSPYTLRHSLKCKSHCNINLIGTAIHNSLQIDHSIDNIVKTSQCILDTLNLPLYVGFFNCVHCWTPKLLVDSPAAYFSSTSDGMSTAMYVQQRNICFMLHLDSVTMTSAVSPETAYIAELWACLVHIAMLS